MILEEWLYLPCNIAIWRSTGYYWIGFIGFLLRYLLLEGRRGRGRIFLGYGDWGLSNGTEDG